MLLTAIGLGLVVLLFVEFVDLKNVREWMQHLDRRLLLVLVAILPLVGFSISMVYLVIGAVFGGPVGVAVVAGITAIHLLASHWLGEGWLREPVRRWLSRRKREVPAVPKGEEWSVALMTALVPGLPYVVRNYVLALSGIPLRTYFWICWPIYVARSCLVLFLGDFADDFSPKRLMILGGVFVLKISICAVILHRLRKRLKTPVHKKPERTALQKRLARIGRMD